MKNGATAAEVHHFQKTHPEFEKDHKRSLRISRANHASSFFFLFLSVYVITLEEMIIIVYQRFRKSC